MCAVTNFRVRRLPSVKRTPARFYFVKSYPFFNPPSALRPISEKFAGRVWADAVYNFKSVKPYFFLKQFAARSTSLGLGE